MHRHVTITWRCARGLAGLCVLSLLTAPANAQPRGLRAVRVEGQTLHAFAGRHVHELALQAPATILAVAGDDIALRLEPPPPLEPRLAVVSWVAAPKPHLQLAWEGPLSPDDSGPHSIERHGNALVMSPDGDDARLCDGTPDFTASSRWQGQGWQPLVGPVPAEQRKAPAAAVLPTTAPWSDDVFGYPTGATAAIGDGAAETSWRSGPRGTYLHFRAPVLVHDVTLTAVVRSGAPNSLEVIAANERSVLDRGGKTTLKHPTGCVSLHVPPDVEISEVTLRGQVDIVGLSPDVLWRRAPRLAALLEPTRAGAQLERAGRTRLVTELLRSRAASPLALGLRAFSQLSEVEQARIASHAFGDAPLFRPAVAAYVTDNPPDTVAPALWPLLATTPEGRAHLARSGDLATARRVAEALGERWTHLALREVEAASDDTSRRLWLTSLAWSAPTPETAAWASRRSGAADFGAWPSYGAASATVAALGRHCSRTCGEQLIERLEQRSGPDSNALLQQAVAAMSRNLEALPAISRLLKSRHGAVAVRAATLLADKYAALGPTAPSLLRPRLLAALSPDGWPAVRAQIGPLLAADCREPTSLAAAESLLADPLPRVRKGALAVHLCRTDAVARLVAWANRSDQPLEVRIAALIHLRGAKPTQPDLVRFVRALDGWLETAGTSSKSDALASEALLALHALIKSAPAPDGPRWKPLLESRVAEVLSPATPPQLLGAALHILTSAPEHCTPATVRRLRQAMRTPHQELAARAEAVLATCSR